MSWLAVWVLGIIAAVIFYNAYHIWVWWQELRKWMRRDKEK